MICINDEYPLKALGWIDVTDGGIVICVNDEHPEKASFPIEVTIPSSVASKSLFPFEPLKIPIL